jgi:hypothetical protein
MGLKWFRQMFGRKSGQFQAVGKSERSAGLFVGSFYVFDFSYKVNAQRASNPYSGGKKL